MELQTFINNKNFKNGFKIIFQLLEEIWKKIKVSIKIFVYSTFRKRKFLFIFEKIDKSFGSK